MKIRSWRIYPTETIVLHPIYPMKSWISKKKEKERTYFKARLIFLQSEKGETILIKGQFLRLFFRSMGTDESSGRKKKPGKKKR